MDGVIKSGDTNRVLPRLKLDLIQWLMPLISSGIIILQADRPHPYISVSLGIAILPSQASWDIPPIPVHDPQERSSVSEGMCQAHGYTRRSFLISACPSMDLLKSLDTPSQDDYSIQ